MSEDNAVFDQKSLLYIIFILKQSSISSRNLLETWAQKTEVWQCSLVITLAPNLNPCSAGFHWLPQEAAGHLVPRQAERWLFLLSSFPSLRAHHQRQEKASLEQASHWLSSRPCQDGTEVPWLGGRLCLNLGNPQTISFPQHTRSTSCE